ncbi:MAG: hypothetical protein ACXWUZ_11485 [Allosphingosinicella sp.]
MIELPDWAVPSAASPAYVDFDGLLTPGLGAAVQRIDRMGNRFKAALSWPPEVYGTRGRILVSRLISGKTEGLRVEFVQPGFRIGSPGAPRVNGAGQAGRSLICDGFTPNYAVREGQFFSHEHDGRHYLYKVDSQALANGTGQLVLPITPMLRVEPADNDVLHFARPMIEGYVHGEEWQWDITLAQDVAVECVIEEAA